MHPEDVFPADVYIHIGDYPNYYNLTGYPVHRFSRNRKLWQPMPAEKNGRKSNFDMVKK